LSCQCSNFWQKYGIQTSNGSKNCRIPLRKNFWFSNNIRPRFRCQNWLATYAKSYDTPGISYSELNAGCQFSKSNFETTIEYKLQFTHAKSSKTEGVKHMCVFHNYAQLTFVINLKFQKIIGWTWSYSRSFFKTHQVT